MNHANVSDWDRDQLVQQLNRAKHQLMAVDGYSVNSVLAIAEAIDRVNRLERTRAGCIEDLCLVCDGTVAEMEYNYFEQPLCSDECADQYAAERRAEALIDQAELRQRESR